MATKAESRLTTLKAVSYALVITWLIIAAFPFLWTVWGSFKVQGRLFLESGLDQRHLRHLDDP